MSAGRPLRFLVAALGIWTGMRTFALWPVAADLRPAIDRIVAAVTAPAADAASLPAPLFGAPERAVHPRQHATTTPVPRNRPTRIAATGLVAGPVAGSHDQTPPGIMPTVSPGPLVATPYLPAPLAPADRAATRWHGSAWGIARGGSLSQPAGAPFGGQLGASQVGARVTYALGEARRVALAARASAPIEGRGREIAVGVDWQPTKAPVHLIVERRLPLDGGAAGSVAEIVGGFGPTRLVPGLAAEGYAQAGVVARHGVEAFADGAARLVHPLRAAPGLRAIRLDIGVGVWGGAQRGAARLDTGPSLGVAVPLGARSVRVTLDWRHRIAGHAAPGSGPALSVGTDF